MFFYIDPGTGSMLFTILIGVLSAAIYALRNCWVKLKVIISGKQARNPDHVRTPFVFFTDSKRYWTIFRPLCDEMEKRGVVSAQDGAKPRKTMITREEFLQEFGE